MTEFAEHLAELEADETLEPGERELVKSAREQWDSGIIPHSKLIARIGRIRKARSPTPCARIELDGSCGWLRKYGSGYNLPVPPQGEPAKCFFGSLQPRCPGYKTRSR